MRLVSGSRARASWRTPDRWRTSKHSMSRAFVRSAGACHRYSLALCFALGGLIAVTAVVILLIQHSWKPVEQRLSDGTILRVEAMTLGSTHSHPYQARNIRR